MQAHLRRPITIDDTESSQPIVSSLSVGNDMIPMDGPRKITGFACEHQIRQLHVYE